MESDIVEIYVDPTTKQILEYSPAADIVLSGGQEEIDLPEDAIFVIQINIDDVIQQAKKVRDGIKKIKESWRDL